MFVMPQRVSGSRQENNGEDMPFQFLDSHAAAFQKIPCENIETND